MKEATLPPGRYYIGDPCFILTTEDEGDFNEAINWKPEDPGYDPWVAGVVYKTEAIAKSNGPKDPNRKPRKP